MVDVRMNEAAIRRFIASPGGEVARTVNRYTRLTEAACTAECPVDEGQLRASVRSEVKIKGLSVTGRVWYPTPYAIYVHDGRGPVHAKPGKVLAFKPKKAKGQRRKGKWNGWVFVKSVGPAKPNPWMYRALKRTVPWPVHRNPAR